MNPELFNRVIPESSRQAGDGSWHLHVPSGTPQHAGFAPGKSNQTFNDDDVDIDIGEETDPVAWLQSEAEEMYPMEPEIQVLGKRTLDDSEVTMNDLHNPQKRQHTAS